MSSVIAQRCSSLTLVRKCINRGDVKVQVDEREYDEDHSASLPLHSSSWPFDSWLLARSFRVRQSETQRWFRGCCEVCESFMSRRRHGLHRCCGPCGRQGPGGQPVRQLGETVVQPEPLQRSDGA
jgi:hypothetical protein